MENARKITEEQKVILDKIKHVHRFFEELDILCNAVKEVSYLTSGSSQIILNIKKKLL